MSASILAPMLPVLDAGQLTPKARALPAPWDTARWVSSGRAGIAVALQDVGMERGVAVWVPSYYCLSMITPIERLGMHARFYPVTENLEIDVTALRRQFALDVRAIVVPHYFGFPQKNMQELRKFCSEKSIFLIEDCAHALIGRDGERRVGTWGDYAIASLPKFFPTLEGGLVTGIHGRIDATTYHPSIMRQLKTWTNVVEAGLQWGRNPPKQRFAAWNARRTGQPLQLAPPLAQNHNENANDLEPYALTEEMLTSGVCHATRYAVLRTDLNNLAQRRRDNFQFLLESVRGWRGARPVFSSLPEGVVPYMFPLELKMPAQQFSVLKAKGVPMYRWEHTHPDFHPGLCAVGARYARSLIQLPVHQGLTNHETERIAHALHDVLA